MSSNLILGSTCQIPAAQALREKVWSFKISTVGNGRSALGAPRWDWKVLKSWESPPGTEKFWNEVGRPGSDQG
ncbi:MAG: hypothetical protein LBD33_00885 [Puniceicoccales bacterium]|nr:hypothetical protein [Puniceicoccales bacterium]